MKYLIMVVMAIMFSGCSQMAIDAGNKYIKKHNLENSVTTVCYDLVDKKSCPKGTKQLDINILPFIPLSSRFCLGFVDIDSTKPDGMYCYKYDIIKNK